MNYLIVTVAGIAGTALMTSFLYVISYVKKQDYKVVKILGTMITGETTRNKGLSNSNKAILSGVFTHYLIGILFSLSFLFLWNLGIGKPDVLNGIILGIVYGFIAVNVWLLFFKVHPNPPVIPLKTYLVMIFFGHIIFALTVVCVFNLFSW